MATTVTFYVNTASTPGGDGTTNNTTGTTRAFASLSDAEAALQRNLVTSDQVLVLNCSGTAADTTAVTWSGWTADATRYVEIVGNNTTGAWDTTKYRLVVTAAAPAPMLFSGLYYVRMRNMQVEMVRTGTSTAQAETVRVSALTGTNNADVRFDACFVKANTFDATITGNTHGFSTRLANSGQTTIYSNCVSYVVNTNGGTDYAFIAQATSGSAARHYWYNCTGYGQNGDFQVASGSANSVTAKNCAAANGGFTGSALLAANNNASTNASATGTGSLTSVTFTFVDAANLDFHLASGDASGAKTGGANLTADGSYPFSTDIDGHTRPSGSTAWSIGVDEYNSGGASGISGSFSGTIPLTASLASSIEVTGSLAKSIALALSGAASVEVRGVLSGLIPLTGTLVANTTAGGNITGQLTATIPLNLTAAASAEMQAVLSGVVPVVLTGTANLTNRADLAGQIPLSFAGAASAEDRAVLNGVIPVAFVGTGLTVQQTEINASLGATITINFSGEVVQYLSAQGSSWLFERQRARRFIEIDEEQQERLTENASVQPKQRRAPRTSTMPVPPEFAQENDEEMLALLYATYSTFFNS